MSQFGKDRVGRLPVHGAIAMLLDLGGGSLSELDRAGLGLSVATHACRHELPHFSIGGSGHTRRALRHDLSCGMTCRIADLGATPARSEIFAQVRETVDLILLRGK